MVNSEICVRLIKIEVKINFSNMGKIFALELLYSDSKTCRNAIFSHTKACFRKQRNEIDCTSDGLIQMWPNFEQDKSCLIQIQLLFLVHQNRKKKKKFAERAKFCFSISIECNNSNYKNIMPNHILPIVIFYRSSLTATHMKTTESS